MEIQENILLSLLTTLKVGGIARFFAIADSVDDVKEAIIFSRDKNVPLVVIGDGSNILVADEPSEVFILKIGIDNIEWQDRDEIVNVVVGAGMSWDKFVSESVSRNLYGIENLSGIPGTVGASPIQNIGAYGSEVKDVIVSVQAIHSITGEEKIFSKEECLFGYRDSFFKSKNGRAWIIVSVTFQLLKNGLTNTTYKDLNTLFQGKKPTLLDVRDGVLSIRSKKFPDISLVGTAGSFFKNPVLNKNEFQNFILKFPYAPHFPVGDYEKIPLAWVLDNLGLKGYRRGNILLFENQPLVLIALKGATADEINNFADEIEKKVKDGAGIIVEREVQKLL